MTEFFLFTNDLFYVINVRKVNLHRFIKLLSCFGEWFAAQCAKKVAKVEASMKNHPFDIFVEDKP